MNSVRYTPENGTIQINAGRERGGVWLAVSDTCGGIPDGDIDRIFDIAFRGQRARTPDSTGSSPGGGLGLTIVRGLVEAHGGQVDVHNTNGGCRFEVRLPAA